VLHADPGSLIYAGLKQGVDRDTFERAIAGGQADSCLHRFEAKTGDCVFIPAGTVHALGAGLVVAEIQQASDTTYRLFDWNRLGPDGKPRELHVEQGLAVIDFSRGPVMPRASAEAGREFAERLVTCDKFILDRCTTAQPFQVGGDDRFHLLAVLEGQIDLPGDPMERPLSRGETALLPACLGEVDLVPRSESILLDIFLPD
jgi:mannose-6-phosphate isomerase